jgi:steroid 5-alpha reductase family enzyme
MSFQILLINSGITLSLLLICSVVVFLIARLRQDNSVMDIAYGPAFFFAIAGTAYLTDTLSLLSGVIIACIGVWAARLSSRIFFKNFGKPEDARYAAWRKEWLQKGRVYFLVRSYLQVNLLQVLIIFLVSLPGVIALSFPTSPSKTFLLLGLLVFLFGLAYEATADYQLDQFIKRKKAGAEPADLMTTGLFTYSRRPNYFGETLVWWGLTVMVLPLPYGHLALISPLLITYIVTKVTGPMLEKAFLEKYPQKYQVYIDTTNYFIPGKPKPTKHFEDSSLPH